MAHVLDASALTAYFEKEPGYETVQELLTAAATSGRKLLMSTVNWGEVHYVTHRQYGSEKAEEIARIIGTFPIEITDVDIEIARQAALFKAVHKMSYADCFAAGLAKARKATLVTGDSKFRSVEKEIKIVWIR